MENGEAHGDGSSYPMQMEDDDDDDEIYEPPVGNRTPPLPPIKNSNTRRTHSSAKYTNAFHGRKLFLVLTVTD